MGDVVLRQKYLTIREAAELTGVHPVTLKRRLLHLHDVHGGVLVSFGRAGTAVRKYFIKRDRLKDVWASDVGELGRAHTDAPEDDVDQRVDALGHRIEDLETKLAALRNAHRKTRAELVELRRRVAQLEQSKLAAFGKDVAA